MNMFMSDSPSYKFLDAKDFVLLIITITEYIYYTVKTILNLKKQQ